MAIYDTGYVSILLTKEGAARANQLKDDGIELKVTHMRVYRTPTPTQNIPYLFNGNESRATLDSWACFPNHETTFDVIEDNTLNTVGYLHLLGILGAEVGTFSYDAVGLFLEDDTLYAVAVTNRILTKRKANIGSSSNIQQLSFSIAHRTTQEIAIFKVEETIIDYSKITEVNNVQDLPILSVPKEVVYRVTNNSLQTYNGNPAFRTWLASQRKKYIGSEVADMWVMHDHIQLFERLDLNFMVLSNQFVLSIPISSKYPVDLIPNNRDVILSFFNPDRSVSVPAAMRVRLASKTSDSTHYTFAFAPQGVSLIGVDETTQIRATMYIHGSDCIYQDAILSTLKTLTEIEYSFGRTFQTDNSNVNPDTVLHDLWQRNSTWQKLDTRVQVAVSQFDGRLFNPSQLQPIAFKAGDIKHMTLRATNIWLNSTAGSFLPTLSVDRALVAFGQTFRATITAPNVVAGTQIPFYVRTPDKNGILSSPAQTVGYVALDANGVGYIDFVVDWDEIDSQYLVYVGIVGYPSLERIVTITPLQAEVFFASNSTGSQRITNANEGQTVYLCVRAGYSFTDLPMYLKLEPGTTVNGDDFVSGSLPTNVTLHNGFVSVPMELKNDLSSEGVEYLIYGLYSDADRTNKLGANATLTVADTSVTQPPSYSMFFSSSQYSDVPLVADSQLGDSVWLIVKATNVPPTFDVLVTFGGSIDKIADAEPDLPNQLLLTLTNGRGAYRINTIAPTVIPPTGVVKRTLIISSNRTTTFNIYNEYTALYGTPTGDLEVTTIVNPGVYVVGSDTNSPAIDARGAWGPGVVLKADNYGKTLGRGGNGGARSITVTNTNIAGGNGGPAIIAQDTHPLYVNNHTSTGAIISGGGGGSGGAYQYIWYSYDAETGALTTGSDYLDHWSIGGGGGAPLGQNHVVSGGENPGAPGGTTDGMWHPEVCFPSTLTEPGTNMLELTARNGESLVGPINISGGTYGASGSMTGLSSSGKRSADGAAGVVSIGPVYITVL